MGTKSFCHTNKDAAAPVRMVTTMTETSGYTVVILGAGFKPVRCFNIRLNVLEEF